ncbi:MAG: hypothetical protein WBP16_00395 [Ferruginibacter sp.]
MFFGLNVFSQTNQVIKDTSPAKLNPLLYASFKKNKKANPLLQEYIKPTKYELMRWPNYPLTAAQIAARDRINQQSPAHKIANEIIESYISTLIYGKKIAPAVIPKF